jgi:hypothetical protein
MAVSLILNRKRVTLEVDPHRTKARVRYAPDERKDFVDILLCNVLSQRPVDLLSFW